MSAEEPCSSEEAREQADFHRRELNDTLDAISRRLHRTIEGAEEHINRPVVWVKQNPWAAMGIAVALGFVMTGGRSRRRTAHHKLLRRELETAYLEGRHDEQQGAPMKERSYWHHRNLDLQDALPPASSGGGNILTQLVDPIIKASISAVTRVITGL
ncbi:MAG: hypothetical protein ACYCRH_04805 [Acidiferrobacteraceae bacterium]